MISFFVNNLAKIDSLINGFLPEKCTNLNITKGIQLHQQTLNKRNAINDYHGLKVLAFLKRLQ